MSVGALVRALAHSAGVGLIDQGKAGSGSAVVTVLRCRRCLVPPVPRWEAADGAFRQGRRPSRPSAGGGARTGRSARRQPQPCWEQVHQRRRDHLPRMVRYVALILDAWVIRRPAGKAPDNDWVRTCCMMPRILDCDANKVVGVALAGSREWPGLAATDWPRGGSASRTPRSPAACGSSRSGDPRRRHHPLWDRSPASCDPAIGGSTSESE